MSGALGTGMGSPWWAFETGAQVNHAAKKAMALARTTVPFMEVVVFGHHVAFCRRAVQGFLVGLSWLWSCGKEASEELYEHQNGNEQRGHGSEQR